MYIMYKTSDFLLVSARNKMNEGAAQVYFIFAGISKKSEILYIIWLNVGGAIHLLQLQKVKCIAWE